MKEPCLSPAMMNYYANSFKTVANIYKPETFPGSGIYKDYVSLVSIIGDFPPISSGWERIHKYTIKYAVWHSGSPDM